MGTYANPYYVRQGGSLAGLEGVSRSLIEMTDRHKAEKAAAVKQNRINLGRKEAMDAMRTNDPDKMYEIAVKYPEFSESLRDAAKYYSGKIEKNYINSSKEFLLDPTEDTLRKVLTQTRDLKVNEGAPVDVNEDIEAHVKAFRQDPAGVTAELRNGFIAAYPKKWEELQNAANPKGKSSARIAEYKLAKEQGYEGSFMDFRKAVANAGAGTKKQKTGAYIVKSPDGSVSIATGVFDPSTGKLTATSSPLGDNLQVVSRLGETPGEQTDRKIEERRGVEVAAGQEKRASALITRGLEAADATATIRRALKLLETVKTGGLAALSLKTKRFFGIEPAAAGELSNVLGKAVLSQLKETFGAAFTAEEGLRLKRISAAIGKPSAANKRLLTQTLRIAERTAQMAMKAAKKRGDDLAVEDISELLKFSLEDPEDFQSVSKMDTEALLKALGD